MRSPRSLLCWLNVLSTSDIFCAPVDLLGFSLVGRHDDVENRGFPNTWLPRSSREFASQERARLYFDLGNERQNTSSLQHRGTDHFKCWFGIAPSPTKPLSLLRQKIPQESRPQTPYPNSHWREAFCLSPLLIPGHARDSSAKTCCF